MLSPRTLADFQDVLDAITPPVETRNGTLTADDIRRLREVTEREVTDRDPTPPAGSEHSIEQERPIMDPEAASQQQRREV